MAERPDQPSLTGKTLGVWAIGPELALAPVPFSEEVVDGEHRLYVTEADLARAHERARVKAGRFGTPRRGRRSPLAD